MVQIVILCHSYVIYNQLDGERCSRIQRSEGRVLSADTCRWFRAAGGLPLGHLDGEIYYRDSLRAVPPRCVPALPKRSACVVCRYVFGSARRCCCHGSPQHIMLRSLTMGAALRSRPVGENHRWVWSPSSSHLDWWNVSNIFRNLRQRFTDAAHIVPNP